MEAKVKVILIGIIVLFTGISIGRFTAPVKVQEKIVEKIVEHKADDIHTVTTIYKKADGTEITKIDQTDKSVIDQSVSVEKEKTIVNQSTLAIAMGVGFDFRNREQYYIGGIDKRIIGGLSIGLLATTNQQVMVMGKWEF